MKSLFVLFINIYLYSWKVLSSSSCKPEQYNDIFNFGNSLSDTGNFLLTGAFAYTPVGKLPYGLTFFRHPTGRFSDGRLMIDFIDYCLPDKAKAFGLPFLPPYLAQQGGSQIFDHGVNFAVAGATALDAEFFYRLNIGSSSWTNHSLVVQLECRKHFKKSLFLVGEIGGNDYNYRFFAGASIQQVEPSIPLVVEAITRATSALIEEGAVELVVPGNLPIGCITVYLTFFQSPNKTDYDSNGCLKAFNAFSELHNSRLKRALETLRQKYPHAKIIYADYYGAAMQFFHSPLEYGFHKETLFRACCGGGGPYNFNLSAGCGFSGSTACEDPSAYANWDGIHLTEAAHRIIAKGLVYGPFTTPPLTSSSFKNIYVLN
ncbi:hypothetical protein TIFTF001_012789 [Ficus carica]|uniref:Uncharacterized protein n=1 Tax=Ficus carica TaxID=3494 RepID=A0AA88AGL2_FICCA|nr:hypothetical protein TIFTF001_012789 [Ficus carica]